MAKVIAPVEGVNEKIAGVSFVDSVGETDDERALAYFTEAGYDVEAAAKTVKKAPVKEPVEAEAE